MKFEKGNVPWSKGKKLLPNVREKMSRAKRKLWTNETYRSRMLKHLEKQHEKRSERLNIKNNICDWCGKRFHEPPSRKKRKFQHNFCSFKCYGLWRSQNIVGSKHPNWNGGYDPYYGSNWLLQRRRSRQRDNYTCQRCGLKENGTEHDVHHIVPFKEFDDFRLANKLDNLVTLCKPCHSLITNGVIKWDESI